MSEATKPTEATEPTEPDLNDPFERHDMTRQVQRGIAEPAEAAAADASAREFGPRLPDQLTSAGCQEGKAMRQMRKGLWISSVGALLGSGLLRSWEAAMSLLAWFRPLEHATVDRLHGQIVAMRTAIRRAEEERRLAAVACDHWFHKAQKYGRHLEGCLGDPCSCGFIDYNVQATADAGGDRLAPASVAETSSDPDRPTS